MNATAKYCFALSILTSFVLPHKQILIHIHLSDFVFLNLPARIYLVLQLSHAQSDKNLSSNLFENFFSYLQYFASYARIEAMVLESSISP